MDATEYVAADNVANAPTFDLNVDVGNWLGDEDAASDGENEDIVANELNGANGGDVEELPVMNMAYGLAVDHFEGLKLFL